MSVTTNPSAAVESKSERRVSKSWLPSRLQTNTWAILWPLAFVACLPFLVPYFRTLWRQELYQYFPFVFVGVAFLFYERWDRVTRPVRGWMGKSGLLVGVLCLLLGAFIHSTWLGNLGFVCIAAAFFLSQRDKVGGSLGMLTLPMLMLIRIPQLHAQSVVVRLQKITSQVAALVLDVLAVPNYTYGNTIRLPSKDLFVAEACSGIQSAFTMCFLALLILVWRRRPLITTPIYIVAALFLATVANTIRVSTIAVAEGWYQIDWTEGWQHDAIGYFTLGLGALILLSFDSLMSLVLHPVVLPPSEIGKNPLALVWNAMLGRREGVLDDEGYSWFGEDDEVQNEDGSAAAPERKAKSGASTTARRPVFGIVMTSGVVLAGMWMFVGTLTGRADSRPIVSKEALLFDPPPGFLEDRAALLAIADHKATRDGTDRLLGIHADVWTCAANGRPGSLVISQPYVGWHELCVCYEVQDWILDRRYNLDVTTGKPVAVGEFSKGQGNYGYLFFSAIDTDGSVPTPPSYTLVGRIVAPFIPLVTDDFAETSGSAQTIMLQYWTVSSEPLTDDEIRVIADALATVRNDTSQEILAQQAELEPKVDESAGMVTAN